MLRPHAVVVFVTLLVCLLVSEVRAAGDVNLTPSTNLLDFSPTTTPAEAAALVDRDTATAWTIQSNQTNAYAKISFNQPSPVYNFTLLLANSSAVPNSMLIRLIGTEANWVVYINKTCNNAFYHWINKDLVQCVVFPGDNNISVNSPPAVFWAADAINASNRPTVVWWMDFSEIQIVINGDSLDFVNNTAVAFSFSELEVRTLTNLPLCNCDPTGKNRTAVSTCSGSGSCNCRPQKLLDERPELQNLLMFRNACKPGVLPISALSTNGAVTPYYGPLDGGTFIELRGVYLDPRPDLILIGGIYGCPVLVDSTNESRIVCVANPADAFHLFLPMPLHLCWSSPVLSCVITQAEFTYKPNPVVSALSRKKTIRSGGLSVTVSGTNFDSIYGFFEQTVEEFKEFKYPFVCVYVYAPSLPPVGGPRYCFDQENRDATIKRCSVVNSTQLSCTTPAIYVDDDIIENWQKIENINVYLEVHLGIFSDIDIDIKMVNKSVTTKNKFVITAFPNPKIIEKDYDFNVSKGDTHININSVGVTLTDNCDCTANDYTVTVNNVSCQIDSLVTNTLSCTPPRDEPQPRTPNGAYPVVLTVGNCVTTVGRLTYVKAANNRANRGYSLTFTTEHLMLYLLVIFCEC